MQFQRNDKKRSAQPASEGRPAKDLQPTKTHPQRRLLLANPAHAGKRARWGQGDTGTRDHPRMCGEKPELRGYDGKVVGSPPHMRGKVPGVLQSMERVGITPACAGKSALPDWKKNPPQDHPRMCGEKGAVIQPEGGAQGSPPRMRGKVSLMVEVSARQGITPAYVGKSTRPNKTLRGSQDHPRVCGEKSHQRGLGLLLLGSPPHVRGKDPVLYLRQCLQVRPDHARHLVHLSFLRA